ncbi:MAG: putative integral rane protein [Thermoplasmata archaeon]|nr:putative integral rane protein [Thermoplasmata archaeon]
MSLDVFLTVKWLHVLSAAAVVGGVAALPMIRAFTRREGMPGAATARVLESIGQRLVVPAAVLLLLTGLTMASGFSWVTSPYSFRTARWTIVGLTIWIAVTVLMSTLVGIAERKIAKGEPEAPHWARWRVGIGLSALLLVLAVFVMVFKPTL